jgi:hypothetical protein
LLYSIVEKISEILRRPLNSIPEAIIIFTGLLSSTAFLGRLLKAREWLGMLTVIMGLSVVGASDFIFGSGSSNNSINSIITGDLLIVMAQIVTASQMVWEDKFVTKHNVPLLQAVGWDEKSNEMPKLFNKPKGYFWFCNPVPLAYSYVFPSCGTSI